jgi:hypothetical protein
MSQPDATEHLHRSCIAAFHLRQELRLTFFLKQDATDTAKPEIHGQGETNRSGADNDDLGIHASTSATSRSDRSKCVDFQCQPLRLLWASQQIPADAYAGGTSLGEARSFVAELA